MNVIDGEQQRKDRIDEGRLSGVILMVLIVERLSAWVLGV
jgi:hypothetical protein